MQDFQAQHPAPRSVRRGSHHEANSINQIAGPRGGPWRVTAANFRQVAEQPHDELEGVLEEVANLEQQPQRSNGPKDQSQVQHIPVIAEAATQLDR